MGGGPRPHRPPVVRAPRFPTGPHRRAPAPPGPPARELAAGALDRAPVPHARLRNGAAATRPLRTAAQPGLRALERGPQRPLAGPDRRRPRGRVRERGVLAPAPPAGQPPRRDRRDVGADPRRSELTVRPEAQRLEASPHGPAGHRSTAAPRGMGSGGRGPPTPAPGSSRPMSDVGGRFAGP